VSAFVLAPPAVRAEPASAKKATAVFAGGCYWGVESVFRHVKGVSSAVSGFAVPVDMPPALAAAGPNYVEAVRVEYDPTQVTYAQLLEIFFLVAHDPTDVDRQGPDVGPEYRSVIFIGDTAQRRVVQAYIDQLAASKTFAKPIVTQLAELRRFREADPDQQDYATKNQGSPYVIINDAPKLEALKRKYAALYRE
jgi:peptide-methionine (S)-S-oxide reductase